MALIWAALTGDFTIANMLLGFLLGWVLLQMTRRLSGREQYFQPGERMPTLDVIVTKLLQVGNFLVVFAWEVIVANIDVLFTVLSPRMSFLRPGIVAVPLDIDSDGEITMLANMITLTPGTLSLDVSEDRKVIYVHSVYIDDPEDKKQEIKQSLERLVHEVFG
jgi:multicomponent Na+:H+ antiporter subunit E